MTGLANQLHDGDVNALVDSVNRYFQSVAAYLSPLDDSSIPPPPDVVPDEFTISILDVERKLSRVKVHKAPGPDGLPKSSRRSSVRHLYNASIREGFVPSL